MNERKTITTILFLTSVILFIFLRFILQEDEFRIFGVMIVAGFISVSILVWALDMIFRIWLYSIAHVIDFFIDAYFKEIDRREKESGKNEPQNTEGYDRSDRG